MVAELYGVSIALVSLVAEDREWFKSAHGPDASETPRDIGLSRHVVAAGRPVMVTDMRSEEHTSELQSLMRISYAVFCLKKKKTKILKQLKNDQDTKQTKQTDK